jgi:hypothetical protein
MYVLEIISLSKTTSIMKLEGVQGCVIPSDFNLTISIKFICRICQPLNTFFFFS